MDEQSITAEIRELARSIPVPVGPDGAGAGAYVGSPETGSWQVYFAVDGREHAYVGPSFPRDRRGSRRARALAAALDERRR